MATAVETESPASVGVNRLVKYGLFAVVAASVVNAVIRVVALALFDVPAEFELFPLGWGPVIVTSAVGAVGAAIVYGVISRYSHRPNWTFTIVAAVVLVLSFGSFLAPPPALAGASPSVFTTLGVMHVAAAITIVSVLTQIPISGVDSP
jgi:hypothetical protein